MTVSFRKETLEGERGGGFQNIKWCREKNRDLLFPSSVNTATGGHKIIR